MLGTAENTPLLNQSVDLITIGQAFHWFDIERFLLECQRILKENGLVAILYNHGDYSKKVINDISELSRKYCPLYKGSSGGVNIEKFNSFFETYETNYFSNDYILTLEQFLGLNFSASYAPKPRDKFYEEYKKHLTNIFNEYSKNKSLIMPNHTICRLGRIKKQ